VITAVAAGKSFAEFDRDIVLRSAVERQFEIIGEARSRSLHASMPRYRRRCPICSRSSPARVWRAIEDNLPPLRAALTALLVAPE
jgi:uncharacterized protein with HEPN domain